MLFRRLRSDILAFHCCPLWFDDKRRIQSEDDALAFVGEFRRRRDTGANNVWIVKPIGELAHDSK